MSRSMKTLVKRRPEPGMTLEERPVPEPGQGEVLIRVDSVGIDGGVEALIYDWHESMHYLAEELPRVFGHEFAGTIDKVGDGVTAVSQGDPVAVEPGVTCGQCRNCRAGRMDVCENRSVIGIDRGPGALAEYVVVPESNVYVLDPSISMDHATFLEVLALGVNALEYSQFTVGDRVAISGPGPVGLGVLVACVAGGAGATTVIGAEIDEENRLPIASEMGATETVTIDELDLDNEVDVFVEASGQESALEAATTNTRRGGQIVQLGLFHGQDSVPVDLNSLVSAGVDFQTTRSRRDSSWRRAIAISRDVDLSPIVGPCFDFGEFDAAFTAKRQREGVKIVLNP